MGEGAKAAAERRNLAKRLEVGRRREQEVHYQTRQMCGAGRVGQTYVIQAAAQHRI